MRERSRQPCTSHIQGCLRQFLPMTLHGYLLILRDDSLGPDWMTTTRSTEWIPIRTSLQLNAEEFLYSRRHPTKTTIRASLPASSVGRGGLTITIPSSTVVGYLDFESVSPTSAPMRFLERYSN